MTIKLWQAICNPPFTHPLFRRIIRNPSTSYWQLILILMFSCLLASIILFPVPTVLMFLLLSLMYPAFLGTVSGLVWSISSSYQIYIAHQQGIYELVAMTPEGAIGANWIICMGSVYHSKLIERNHRHIRRMFWWLLILTGTTQLLVWLNIDAKILAEAQKMFLLATFLLIICYIDYVQSSVISCLVGMITPYYAQTSVDARLFAAAGFMLLQVVAYLVVVSLVWGFSHIFIVQSVVMLIALGLLVLISTRELIIWLLWRILRHLIVSSRFDSSYILGEVA